MALRSGSARTRALTFAAPPHGQVVVLPSGSEYPGHKKKVHSVAWNCTGSKLASGSVDQCVRIWALDESGRATDSELKGHQDSVDQLRWERGVPPMMALLQDALLLPGQAMHVWFALGAIILTTGAAARAAFAAVKETRLLSDCRRARSASSYAASASS